MVISHSWNGQLQQTLTEGRMVAEILGGATLLEGEAFLDIHEHWKSLGYPFDHLVPSLATALGSSGDRPAALAELMGIILNDGVRQSTLRIDQLHFAADTPYETLVGYETRESKRVMTSEVAATLRDSLSKVVEGGTARRLQGTFTLPGGEPLVMGGKTGTGDNRIQTVTRSRPTRKRTTSSP